MSAGGKISRPIVFIVLAVLPFLKPAGVSAFLQDNDSTPLKAILRKSAAYCEGVRRAALFFICEERIREEIYPSSKRSRIARFRTVKQQDKNEYVYDYQLVKKDERVEESRTLIEENGVKKKVPNAPLKTKRFMSLKTAYAGADFIGPSTQSLYSYDYLGEDRVLRRDAYLLRSRPKIESEAAQSYGRIWVDKESFAILKIEREPESTEGFAELKEKAASKALWPVLSIVHEFGIEKNGVRFPSRTEYRESYAGNFIPKFEYSRATIDYSNYKFFIVEVTIEQ